MKKVPVALGAIAVLALLTSFAMPQTQPELPTCSATPPARPTYTELDPNPARYTGPACFEDEECTTPAGWHEETGYKLTDKGAEITYTDMGQMYTYECPAKSFNQYRFEEDQWVKDPEKCWVWKPVRISECS